MAGRPVPLPPRAFDVLCELARNAGRLVAKDRLLDAVWGHQHVSESVLKTTVSELRAALDDDPRVPQFIETVARRGYRFIAAVSPLAASPSSAAQPLRASPAGHSVSTQFEVPHVAHGGIVGRRASLDRLHDRWREAREGRRQICWVAGEPGIGKTTLIEHFVADVPDARRAHGQCVEQHGAGEPYLPVLEALGSLCADDPALPGLMRSVAPTWLLQLPWHVSEPDREALQRELAGVNQERMLRELGELLDRYTRERPLLLVTEDLHWSDHATVHLLNHVARRRGPARLMWLASFRLAEVIAEEHPLKAVRHELRLHNLCDEIVLDPFSEFEVGEYLQGRRPGRPVSETLVRALHARTDGLPLFVSSVADELAEGAVGAVEREGDQAAAVLDALQVPENLAAVIERQIATLPEAERSLLEAASVCGVEFDPAIAAEALGLDPLQAEAICERLGRHQRWLVPGTLARTAAGALESRFGFRHALHRHVLYQRLTAIGRARLHRAVAEALARARSHGSNVTASELAAHFEQGHEAPAAAGHYAEAAELALRRFAPAEAMILTGRALALLPALAGRPERDALEIALSALRGSAAAQVVGVSSLETRDAFQRGRELLARAPGHPLRGLVLHGLGLSFLVRGEYDDARQLCEATYAAAGSGDPASALSACSVMGQVHSLQGRQPEAIEWLERGLAVCDALGDAQLSAAFVVDPAVTLHTVAAMPLLHMGHVDKARMHRRHAQQRAQALGEPMARMIVCWFGSLFGVRIGDAPGVAAFAREMRTVSDEAAIAQGWAPSRWFGGWTQARQGDPHAGHAAIREAFDHNVRMGMLSGGSEVLGYAAEALVLAGEWERAWQTLDEAFDLAERIGERVYQTQLWLLRARCADGLGDGGRALDLAEKAVAEARGQRAAWLELTALAGRCALKSAREPEFQALAAARDRMTEGRDTPLFAHLDSLLKDRL
ncbi:MAG: AAA family ATPase [Betaproteobacteria bacterium]|nr:AAA family ATPase [Betaproteobacteria bacterium]